MIVGGYGRTGKAVARVLAAAGVPLVVVELNHAVYSQIAADGANGIWGDITAPEILHAADVERARLLVLTAPDPATVRLALQRARQANRKIQSIARAGRERQVADFREMGIDSAIQPSSRRRRNGPPGPLALRLRSGTDRPADRRCPTGILQNRAARVSQQSTPS